jgi:hypothetical protein
MLGLAWPSLAPRLPLPPAGAALPEGQAPPQESSTGPGTVWPRRRHDGPEATKPKNSQVEEFADD